MTTVPVASNAKPAANKFLANKMLPFLQKDSPLMPDDRWILKSIRGMYATIPAFRRDVRAGGFLAAMVGGVAAVALTAGVVGAVAGAITLAGVGAGLGAVAATAGFAFLSGKKLAARFEGETMPLLLEDIKTRYGDYKKQEMMQAIARRQHDIAVKRAEAKGETPPAPLPVEATGALSKREALKILFGRAGKPAASVASIVAPAAKGPAF